MLQEATNYKNIDLPEAQKSSKFKRIFAKTLNLTFLRAYKALNQLNYKNESFGKL